MSKIRKKLKSQGGASVLIALIFFLTAFMVGTVVLSSAVANADKLILRREERQRYFALSSAARFLRTTIENTKGTLWEEKQLFFCKSSPYEIIDRAGNQRHNDIITHSTEMTVTDTDSKLQSLLAETTYKMYEKLLLTGSPPEIKTEFSIEVEGMETVDVVITMSNNYDLLIELKARGGEENMTMTVDAVKPVTPATTTSSCKHWYKEKFIDENGVQKERETQGNFNIETTRKTLEVTWPTAIITKGGGTS